MAGDRLDDRAFALSTVAMLQWLRAQSSEESERTPIVVHRGATLVPPPPGTDDKTTARFVGGVADAHGRLIPHAHHYSSITPWVASSGQWRGHASDRLAGDRALFGGVAREHFGHFMTESLSRLWPLYLEHPDGTVSPPPDRRFDTLVFLRSPIAAPSAEGLELLSMFDGVPTVTVVDAPTRVDEIAVPMQSSASELGLIGPRAPISALRAHLAPNLAPSTDRSIYVSRSRWDPGPVPYSGSILQEEVVEALLEAAGYEIFHPQQHSVAVQVATYRGAGRIIVNESSAIHLVALAAPASARVAVIGRRAGLGPLLDGYLEGVFGASERSRFLECGDGHHGASVGEVWLALRFAELAQELVVRGLLADATVWSDREVGLDEVDRRRAIFT